MYDTKVLTLSLVIITTVLTGVGVSADSQPEVFVLQDRVNEPYVGLEHPWAKVALNCDPIDIVELRLQPAGDLVEMIIQVGELGVGCPTGNPGEVTRQWQWYTLAFEHPWWDESYLDINIIERDDGTWFYADLVLWYGNQLVVAGLNRDLDVETGEIWIAMPTGLIPPPWTDVSLVSWIEGCAGLPCLTFQAPAFADRLPDTGTFDYVP